MKSTEITLIRERLGFDRRRFAQMIEVSYETLSRWENGVRSPSKTHQAKILRLADPAVPSATNRIFVFRVSNLRHLMHAVSASEARVFGGVIQVETDPDGNVALARIRLLPEVQSLVSLGEGYLRLSSSRREGRSCLPVWGIFVAFDGTVPPLETMNFQNINYCMTLDKRSKKLRLWHWTANPLLPGQLMEVPFYTVGIPDSKTPQSK